MSVLKREIPCEFYVCKGECKKNRKASHSKACQICNLYRPRSRKPHKGNGSKHAKAKKLALIREREKLDEYYAE